MASSGVIVGNVDGRSMADERRKVPAMSRGVALRVVVLALGVSVGAACAGSEVPDARSDLAVAEPPPTALPAGADGVFEAPVGTTSLPAGDSTDVAVEAPEVFTGPPPAAVPPPTQLAATSSSGGSGVWAVIIGIDDYPGTRYDLRAAGNDATDMDAALARFGVPAQQRLRLGGGAATATNVRRSLRWLTERAGPEATAVFFYAGHVRKTQGHEVLVGADGATVPDTEVAELLRPLRARATWIVIAACYGGGFTEVLGPNRILMAAAPADQLAYESPELGRSYLVEYLVRRAMLMGQADRSVEHAYAWAVAALRREHPNRLPVAYDDLPGDLVLGPALGPPPAPPSPPARPAPPPTPTTTTTAPPRNDQCIIRIGGGSSCTG